MKWLFQQAKTVLGFTRKEDKHQDTKENVATVSGAA